MPRHVEQHTFRNDSHYNVLYNYILIKYKFLIITRFKSKYHNCEPQRNNRAWNYPNLCCFFSVENA